ncbi:MAG TPA: hypothetical protein GX519_02695 [Thermoanaerobacterales bacterium]|nr:hypothetical protein [Thermoanaerobacterales bacterium]
MIKRITVVFILLLLCGIAIVLLNDYNYNGLIPTGIYIGDVDVGGLTKKEATDTFQSFIKEKIKNPIILTFNDKQWVFAISEHIDVDVDKSVDNIIKYIQSKNVLQRINLHRCLKKAPFRGEPIIKYKEDNLRQTFAELNEAIITEPIDAAFKVNDDDTVSIVDDVKGQVIDEDKLKESIAKAIWSNKRKLEIPTKEWKAGKTKEALVAMGIKIKVAEYSTKFNKNLKGRTENIKIAGRKINGYTLAPEDIFSFNETVGERTRDKGYQEAPVFIDNETVPDIGGGICQVSSTLYNLALQTDLEIIERMNHSLPVSYVPLGRDATVNYDTIDLKFRNNTGGYLLLIAEVIEDNLTVKFYGKNTIDTTVELFSETIKTIPSPVTIKKDFNLKKGEVRIRKGTPGYVVNLWKKYTKGGKIHNVLISRDTYNPTPTLLYMGEKVEENQNIDDTVISNELLTIECED